MASLSRELLEEIVGLASEGLLIVDASKPECPIVYANPAYETASGYSADELAGSAWLSHAAMEDEAPELVQLRERIVSAETAETSLPFLRKDGGIWLGNLRLSLLKSAGHGRRLWIVQHQSREMSAGAGAELMKRMLSRARHKLTNLERIDAATGLLSRSELELLLRRELATARRDGGSISLLIFSVPELDIYRQTFGDNAADSCLRMIGAQLSGTFRRSTDICARFDRSLLAAVIRGQDEAQARQLVALVETKVRNLGLRNPRGRMDRAMFVRGAFVQANSAGEDLDGFLSRAVATLAGDNPSAVDTAAAASTAAL